MLEGRKTSLSRSQTVEMSPLEIESKLLFCAKFLAQMYQLQDSSHDLLSVSVLNRQCCVSFRLKWYYDHKSPYLFFLYFESMNYKYLRCQILSHDFDEKSDFLNYEFSIRLPAITQFKNGLVQKRVGSREDVT